MIKRVEALQKFLKAVERLAKNNDITIDDAYRFAKQQFGEVSDLMKLQINRLFKKKQASGTREQKEGEVIDVSFKPGKSKYRDKIIEESPSQKISRDQEDFLKRVGRQIEQDRKELGPIDTKEEGITFSVPEKGIFNQKTSIDEVTEMLTKNPFRPGGGLDPLEGMTRTAARVVLGRRGIDIPEKTDPIDVFEENFGGDALMDLKNVADELLEKETTGNITESMGKFLDDQGMFDLKINKDAPKAKSNKELLESMEEAEAEDILKKFDPEDREPNAMGGINRVGFARGRIKLLQFLAGKGKTLTGEIRKAVDNIFATGDKKYDADVVVDDMMETLGIDRDTVDQKDVLNAYDEAYKVLSKEGIDPRETILPTGDVVSKQLKVMRLAEDIEPGLFEKLTDKQLDIIVKYGDRIDQDLLKNIVLDPDPSNQAAAIATLDEVQTMMDKGMSTDEIMNALKSTPRKLQAEGGLSYLMGM